MSKFFSSKYASLVPYTPGEQPRDMQYIKLNTNESPFPPSPKAQAAASEAAKNLHLYSDPTAKKLNAAMASLYGIDPEMALEQCNKKFISRFSGMEQAAVDAGKTLGDLSLEEMEALWQAQKKH